MFFIQDAMQAGRSLPLCFDIQLYCFIQLQVYYTSLQSESIELQLLFSKLINSDNISF